MNAKHWKLACCLMATIIALSSCEKKYRTELNSDYLPVQMSKGDSWSIVDKEGKEVVAGEYPADATLSRICDGAYWVKQGDTYQLYNIDSPKNPVADEEYTRATDFGGGVAAVSNPNQQICIVDTKGTMVAMLAKDIKRCYAFNEEGFARILDTNDLWGIVDAKGNIVVKPAYMELGVLSDGVALAKKKDDKKDLIIDMKGQKVGELSNDKYYILGQSFSEGKITVRNVEKEDGEIIVLDKQGKKLFYIRKSEGGFWADKYCSGYLTVRNKDAKYGVANEEGELVIRYKYESMVNFGNGFFAAKKGNKWGVVNDKDETVIDFDYDNCDGMMGDNFLMRDGSFFSLIGQDGKEITSFEVVKLRADSYAEYVDVESIVNSILGKIEKFEATKTASAVAKEYGLSADDYRYRSGIVRTIDFNGKIRGNIDISFESNIAEERTHTESVNDGWFTTTHTVSDGWHWTGALPTRISGMLRIHDDAINVADIYKSLCRKLSDGRKKIDENVYSKNVKIGGKTLECRTALTEGNDNVFLEMTFSK